MTVLFQWETAFNSPKPSEEKEACASPLAWLCYWPGSDVPGELWADCSCGQVPLSPACPCSLAMNLASIKIHHKSILSVSIILLFTKE